MMSKESLFSIAYLPLLVRLECMDPVKLPAYLGSALHGILGWALRADNKAYRYLFENRKRDPGRHDIVNPYIIDPPKARDRYEAGEKLCFQLILLGDACSYAQDVIAALVKTGIFELGVQRRRFKLMDILHGRDLLSLWGSGRMNFKPEMICKLRPESLAGCGYCSVQLMTPLRIRRNGQLLTELDFSAVIRNITRRLKELTSRYGGFINLAAAERACAEAEQVKLTASGLHMKYLHRYSERKGEKMEFNGIQGGLTFEGDMMLFVPWLNAAGILHIGRNVTLGCGKINVEFW